MNKKGLFMSSYIVCCDFKGDDKAASEAAGRLNKFIGTRLSPDIWIITADVDIDVLYRDVIQSGVYVFIAEINSGVKISQPENLTHWFLKNHPEIF